MRMTKKVVAILMSAAICISTTGFRVEADTTAEENIVYVSVEGKADAAGTKEDPFASIEQARDYLRTKKLSAENRGTVYVMGGTYYVEGDNPTIELNDKDSYVTYSAYDKEEVTISGTVTLQNANFKKLSEVSGDKYSSQARLPESVKDSVYVYDLGTEGIGVGKIYKNGFNWPKQPFQPELIVDDSLQTMAQYPNSGTMTQSNILAGKTKDGKNQDETAIAAGANEGERPRNYIFDKTDTPKNYEEMLAMKGPVFYTKNGLENRIKTWAPPTKDNESQADQPEVNDLTDNTKYETDGWLSGYFENNYANDMVRIYSVDTDTNTIHCKYPSFQGVQDKRIQLRAINLLCELDTQGEYYIDRYNGNDVLYYFPKDNTVSGKNISLMSTNQPFFELQDATGVQINGIDMTGGTGYGVTMMDCESCTIDGCEFSNISLDAVRIGKNNDTITTDPSYTTSGGGHNNVVRNCSIHDMGCGGVYLSGGDEQTLQRGDNLVEHCEFYNISRLQTYTPAVYLEGVGNTAQYNYIHDAPHMTIQIMGNDMLVTHNYLEDVCTNTSDQAAIYCGRCFNWLGNVISYNYFKNIKSGTYGVYMDDGMSGMIIKNNIFDSVKGCAIFSNSGFGHQITDNIMLNAVAGVKYAVYGGSRPVANEKVLSYRYYRVYREGDGTNYTNTAENISNWYEHYKDLYPYLSDKKYPDEADETWITDKNSVFVASNQTLKRTIMVGTTSSMTTGSVSRIQDADFNSDNYTTFSADKLGLNIETGKISEDSPLAAESAYGTEWIKNWNQNYSLEGIGVPEETKPSDLPLIDGNGDANRDGNVDATDALVILRYVVELDKLTDEGMQAADTDQDEHVTVTDALNVLKFVVKKTDQLPVK